MSADDVLADVDMDAPTHAGSGSGGEAIHTAGAAARKGRGRGAPEDPDAEERYAGRGGVFDSLVTEDGAGPLKSVEGWLVFVTGIHEEAQEDDVVDKFSEFGEVKNINMNLDRRTGFTKGYALIEYASRKDAEAAIHGMNGQKLLNRALKVDWAFLKR